jgi:hypothetical protein
MRLKSVETTPNPNSMKLNLDEKVGTTVTYTCENKSESPQFVQDLLEIDGLKSVFVCNDFLTINRDPRSDWRTILEQASALFKAKTDESQSSRPGETKPADAASSEQALETVAPRQTIEQEGTVHIVVQTFKGIPIQVKATDSSGETRVSLGERFNDLAQSIQNATGANFLKERYWADHGIRYGDRTEIANEVSGELQGVFDEDALKRAEAKAIGATDAQTTVPFETILSWLNDSDWHRRISAIQELKASEETLPLLTKALRDENPQVRRLAAAALGTTGSIEAIPALCEAVLNDKHVGVRRTAGDALSDIGEPLAQPAMCMALADANKLVRWRAARFLFDIGDDEALTYLIEASEDSEFEVRLEVEAAIERIKGGLQSLGPAWRRIVDGTPGD